MIEDNLPTIKADKSCKMPLSTIFQYMVAVMMQFYWWREPEYLEKTTDLP